MSIADEFSPSTGPTSDDGTTCEHSPRTGSSDPTLSREAIHAKGTATPEVSGRKSTKTSGPSSSALLHAFARVLWSERTRGLAGPTLFGPGGECDPLWRELDTLSCPSDSDPVALGLSINGTGCGCSLSVPTPTASQTPCKDVERLLSRRAKYAQKYGNNGFGLTLAQWLAVRMYPTPVASDYKGSTGMGSRKGTLAERAAMEAGEPSETVYPHPEFVEAVMRFPISWSELERSGTA